MTDPPAAPWLAANLDALAAVGATVDVGAPGRWHLTSAADGPALQLQTASGALVAAHSRRQPAAEAERLVDAALGGRPCPPLAMVIGAGLGAVVDDLLARDAGVRVLVIEPDPSGAVAFLGLRDWTSAIRDRRLLVLSGPGYRGAERAWRVVPAVDAPPVIVIHPVLAREYPDDVRRAAAVGARVVADARANAGAESALAAPYLLNTIENLGVVAHEGDVDALAGAFEGMPAIVAAAGPSLDQVIADLRRLQDRAVVIAVDTALRPLLAQGIAPHLAVAVDPSERNARHLSKLDGAGGTWFVAEPGVHPRAFPAFAGRTFVFRVGDNHPWPWLASRGVARGTLAAWGSVLVSALDLAVRSGAGPIAIVGADLAYTGGQPYCRGTAFEEDWAREVRVGERLADVWARVANRAGAQVLPDLHGRPVPTLPHLVAFRDRLLDQIAASGVRVVNATGGGILHGRGLEIATLDAAVGSTSDVGDLRARLRERHARSRPAPSATAPLSTALADPDTAAALAALVPGVVGERMATAMAQARSAIAAPPAGTPAAVGRRAPTDAAVWFPEQTAALADLASPGAADRAPLPEPLAGPAALEAVVEAARNLLAQDPLVAGPLDADALTADLLALPLPLLLPMAPGARGAGERFGVLLTRWIATHQSRGATADAAFWSTPLISIDPPADAGAVTRPAGDAARMAALTTLAWATARREGCEPVWRAAAAVARSWTRVTREAPRVARVRLTLQGADGAGVSWIDGAALAPLARGLAGTIVRPNATAAHGRRGRMDVPALTVSTILELDLGGDWTAVGESVVAASARLALPEPTVRCLSCSALADGRAVVTRQDGAGSYVIDADGNVTPSASWPAPIFGEGPLDAEGSWYAWSARPARVLVRDAGGTITQDRTLPFTPNAAEVEAGGLRFAALDGVWRWTRPHGIEQVVATPPLVAAWPSAMAGLDLALAPPPDGPRPRTRRHLAWSPEQGLREQDVPPLGPCWSRSVQDGWTAEAFPDADLVRVSDATGVRGWILIDYPRTVAWAGGSLVVVVTDGLVTFVPGVRDALS